jgi:flagellar hook protein FlgE
MPSFDIPISGLNADSAALNTIANNLANMNTTGYKSQTTQFSNLFSQDLGLNGAGDPMQVGSGVQVAANSTDFTGGTISSTGISTDNAISGNGFFILDGGSSSQLLTRDGNFQTSSTGQMQSTNGLSVMGYTAVNGVINTSGGISDINLPTGQVMQPAATTTFGMTQNLNAEAPVGTVVSGQVKVYDSLGKSYEATVTYTAQGNNAWGYNVTMPDTLTPTTTTAGGSTTTSYTFGSGGANTVDQAATNLTVTAPVMAPGTGTATSGTVTFTYGTTGTVGTPPETAADYAYDLGAALVKAGINTNNPPQAGVDNVQINLSAAGVLTLSGAGMSSSGTVAQDLSASAAASGTLQFDANGNLTQPGGNVSGITFSGLSDSATNMNMTWNLYGANGTSTVSQVAATSTTSATTQNGYPSGQYQSFSVDQSGVVTAQYSNGQSQTVGQIALATVTNEQGLSSVGSTDFQTTNASGQASVGVAGAGGRGTITGSALEASNVNISAEFSDLIVAQRAFEASSKAVTTFDTVTQDAIAMVH